MAPGNWGHWSIMRTVQAEKSMKNIKFKLIDATILTGLVITVIIFSPKGFDSFNLIKLIALTITSLMAALGLFQNFVQKKYANGKFRSRGLTPLSKWLLICFSITILLSSLINYENLSRTLLGYPGRYNGVVYYISLLIIVIWISQNSETKIIHKILRYFLNVTGFLVSGYGFLQAMGWDFVSWENPYNPVIATFGNPNFAAAYCAIISIWHFGNILEFKGNIRIFHFIGFVLALYVSIVTESIQGPLLSGLGIALLILVKFHNKYGPSAKTYSTLFTTIVLSLFLLVSMFGVGPLGRDLYEPTLRIRFLYWKTAWTAITQNLFFGTGPDTFAENYKIYREPEIAETWGWSVFADSAHNVFLNFGVSFGLISLLILISLFIVSLKNAIRYILRKQSSDREVRLFAIVFVLFFLQAQFSIEQIGLSIPLWILFALFLRKDSEAVLEMSAQIKNSRKTNISEVITVPIYIGILLVGLLFGSKLQMNNANFLRLYGYISNPNDQTRVNQDFVDNIGLNFRQDPRYSVRIAQYSLLFGNADEGVRFLRELISKNPSAPEPLELLAIFLEEKGDKFNALEFRRKLEQVDPYNLQNLLRIALLLQQDAKYETADNYFKRIISVSPQSQEAMKSREQLELGR